MRKKVDSAWVQCFWLRHLHSETNYLSVEVWVQSFWTLLKDCSPFFLLQHTTQVAVASIQPITPHHQNSTYLLPMQLLFTCPPLTHALPKYKYRPFFSLPVFGDHMKTCLSQFIDGTLKRKQEWILIAHPLLSPHFSKRYGPLLLSNPPWSRWEAASRSEIHSRICLKSLSFRATKSFCGCMFVFLC